MALLSIGEILDLGNSANMSSYIPYSALDYDPTGAISGISGSAIAGGVDSSVVSSIVSSMVSSKADQSALEDCCSSMSSVVSSIQNDVSGISSYVSGLTVEYLEKSASSMFAPSGNYMSASESSSFYPMTGNPSGFLTGVDLSEYATTAYVDSSVSGKLDASASSQFQPSGYYQPSGDYAYNSSLSSYLYASSSSLFQPSGDYQTAGDYAYNSSVSSKLDASASSEFYLTSNPSGFITEAYTPEFGYDENNHISSIDGSALSVGNSGDYVEKSATEVAIGRVSTAIEYSLSQGSGAYASGGSFAQGVGADAKYHSLAQGSLASAANAALSQGEATYAHSWSLAQGIQTYADSGSFAQGRKCSATYYSVAQGLGATSNYAAAVFGSWNSDGEGSGESGIALAIGDGQNSSNKHNLFEVRKNGTLTIYSGSSDNIGIEVVSSITSLSSDVTNKLDKTESSSFYPMYSNPSGYLTSVDINECVLSAGSGIDFRVDGQGVYIDVNFYNAFTSLSAWATAQGWTGV